VADPPRKAVDEAYGSSLVGFTRAVYQDRVRDLAAAIHEGDGAAGAEAPDAGGVLHALFGKWVEAEAAFRGALKDDPALVSAYVNLANVRLLTQDDDGALDVVLEGLTRNQDSPLLNLLAARIYADKGDTEHTAAYYARLKRSSPSSPSDTRAWQRRGRWRRAGVGG